jgi:hypothetical protein
MAVSSAITDSTADSTAHISRVDVGRGNMTRCIAQVSVTQIGMWRPDTTTRASRRDAITADRRQTRGHPVRRAGASLDQRHAVPLPQVAQVWQIRAVALSAAPAGEPVRATVGATQAQERAEATALRTAAEASPVRALVRAAALAAQAGRLVAEAQRARPAAAAAVAGDNL